MIHVFIIGSKGIPAQYGGFETFVENLTARKQSNTIQYHVSCMDNEEKVFEHNGAECFGIRLPFSGAPGRIFHVGLALHYVEKWCETHTGEKTIVYILGCRIGPLLISHSMKLRRLGVKIFCNPDGLEWKRDKWSFPEKLFLKYCESCLVRYSDLAICDSKAIEKYIKLKYKKRVKQTTFIAYGADVGVSQIPDQKIDEWFRQFGITRGNYYLIVGRFVPENNYETMITEYMKSKTSKDLVIITNVEKNRFYESLREKTGFMTDSRIKFVGTVYDKELLKRIREEAYGYLHGHEVGGTNPSLLEAIATTKINLLLDVEFNKEVAEDCAFYWNKCSENLSSLIDRVDMLEDNEIKKLSLKGKQRIEKGYNWNKICNQYEQLFLVTDEILDN